MIIEKLPVNFESLRDPTIKQSAEILQTSVASIFRLCRKGDLKRYKVGGLTRIHIESIEKLRSAAA